jgi:hypothetical protein
LVTFPYFGETNLGFGANNATKAAKNFQNACGFTAAQVIDFTNRSTQSRNKRVDAIFDESIAPNLMTVAKNSDWLA